MESTPKKSLGQHWLEDPIVLDAMCDAANVQAGDHVLEIGPGMGTLTERLATHGALVTALEFDVSLLPGLEQRFTNQPNVQIEAGDIRSYDFAAQPEGYKIVANIPYYLTSNLIQLISETTNPPVQAALLIQKEVAERAVAKPGDMSLLSVTTQFYWQASAGMVVPAELFIPPPKVDSQILILSRPAKPILAGVDPKAFFRLVKAGFSQRRKTLLNSLSGGLHLSKPEAEKLLTAAHLDHRLRPQNLSLEQWYKLYKCVEK